MLPASMNLEPKLLLEFQNVIGDNAQPEINQVFCDDPQPVETELRVQPIFLSAFR